MNKLNLAAVSLIAAIPAAVLVILLAGSLLYSFGDMPGAIVGLVAVALIASSVTAVLPVGIVIFGGKAGSAAKAPKVESEKGKKEAAAVAETGVDVDEVVSDEIIDDDDTDFVVAAPDAGVSTGELDVVEGAFTEDNLPSFEGAVSDPNIDVFEDDAMEEFGDIEFDDEDEKKS